MKHNERPIYRALMPVVLTSDGRIYLPGTILDLSHLTPEQRKQMVARGVFETASGEPANVPATLEDGTPNPAVKRAAPCKNCP